MRHTCTKVTLRQKPITKGRISLYLDYYPAIRHPETMKMTRREFLGIYIYAEPHNRVQRDYNEEMLEKAEGIRCIRATQLINEEFGFLDQHRYKEDFLAYYKKLCRGKDQKWERVYGHFYKFCGGKCSCGDVTVELCKRFRDYLLDARQLRRPARRLCNNSAAGYYSTFRGMLNIAYRDKRIRENVNDFLQAIETEDVKKEFLTLNEVKQLAASECKIPVLKQASLFSCLTGLRISDILKLRWEDFEEAPEGGYNMRIRTQKTKTEATLPVSDEAMELCGEPGTGIVFKGLKRHMTTYPLRAWLKEAGIKKKITFHGFRHTYATLQIASGTDIYTVSKMLTHKNVTTTQIYADLVSEKKRETTSRISLK